MKEQLRSAGVQAWEGIRKLAQAASVRCLRVKDPDGKVLVQLPFGATVLGTFIAPAWASAAFLGAIATGHTVDVERLDAEEDRATAGRAPPEERELHAPH